nr:LON peptidase substrate-binding domain-containing protein [Victivallales bacterium]
MSEGKEKIPLNISVDNAPKNGNGSVEIVVNPENKVPVIRNVHLLPLKDIVLFPFSLAPLVIEGEANIAMIEKLIAGDRMLGLFSEISSNAKEIQPDLNNGIGSPLRGVKIGDKTYSEIGVLARIVKMLRFPDGSIRVLVRGLRRIKFLQSLSETPPHLISATEISEDKDNSLDTIAMAKNAVSHFHEIITSSPFYPDDLRVAVMNINDNSRLADLIADTLNFRFMEKLSVLSALTLHSRFQLLTILLNREIEILHLGSKIHSQVSSAMGQAQREYYLREQLKTIKKELGEDARNPDIVALSDKFTKKKLPPKVKEIVDKELERLQIIPQASAEYNVSHTYLNWLADLPWGEFTEDSIDISAAAKILDTDHYDLKD